MRYPAFVAYMASEANRPKLWMGIRSGYGMALAFGALALTGQLLGIIPWSWSFYVLVLLKLVTNTVSYLALRLGRGELALAALNMVMDLVVMTGAIYYTGGQVSPLFPIYVIEITIIGLLTNLGITISVAVVVLALYSCMIALTQFGVLAAHPPPVAYAGGITPAYTVINLIYAGFVLGVATVSTTAILRVLQQKQRALEARERDLVDAGRQKSQFMANITHELRTPIHGIFGLSDLVETGVYGPINPKQKEAQQSIKRSAQALLQLIDDLLQLAKDEAGKLEFKPTEIDLTDLIPSAVASIKWMLGPKNIQVDTDLEPELPSVQTDRGKFNQVLINLLANAVKFTPDGGRVVVRVRREGGDAIAIAVEDTGIGIEPGDLERIFRDFEQADGSLRRTFGGVGLGLPLVRRLIRLMGGKIAVVSEPGKGSRFTVTLPVEARRARTLSQGAG